MHYSLPLRASGALLSILSTLAMASSSPAGNEPRRRKATIPAKRATTGRVVFAHVVMGDWQSYTAADWQADITLAKAANIDAFALNCGHDSSDPTQLGYAYSAAEAIGGFKVFVSYASLFGSSDNIISQYIAPFAGRSGQFLYNGMPLLSTFSGEVSGTYLEGNSSINAAWTTLKSKASAQGFNIFFLPFWTGLDASSAVSTHPVVDGIGQWLSWSSAPLVGLLLPLSAFKVACAEASYQPQSLPGSVSISAAQTTIDDRNLRISIYKSDQWLIVTRYLQLLAMSHVPDLIELQTWNDYGESHYIGPVRANAGLPGGTVSSSTYVNSGTPHSAILGLISILNVYYKTGVFPIIAQTQLEPSGIDHIHREHPPPTTQLVGRTIGIDSIYVAVVVKPGSAATTVVVTIGTFTVTQAVSSGSVNLVKCQLVSGTPSFTFLNAAGVTLANQSGSEITATSVYYDYNFVAGVLPYVEAVAQASSTSSKASSSITLASSSSALPSSSKLSSSKSSASSVSSKASSTVSASSIRLSSTSKPASSASSKLSSATKPASSSSSKISSTSKSASSFSSKSSSTSKSATPSSSTTSSTTKPTSSSSQLSGTSKSASSSTQIPSSTKPNSPSSQPPSSNSSASSSSKGSSTTSRASSSLSQLSSTASPSSSSSSASQSPSASKPSSSQRSSTTKPSSSQSSTSTKPTLAPSSTSSSSTAIPVASSAPAPTPANSTRTVFAHVVAGVWQSYTADDWQAGASLSPTHFLADISLAKAANIDAFALNVGDDDSDPYQLDLAYSAAESIGGFKLFISLDMVYAGKFGSIDTIISRYIVPFAGRSGQFYYQGRPFLSTFAGENPGTWLEGNSDINSTWSTFKSKASAQGFDLFFVPFWTGLDASTAVTSHSVVDGIAQWLSWPDTNASPSTNIDVAFQADALRNGKVYCAPVIQLGNTTTSQTVTSGSINLVKAPLVVGTPTFSLLNSAGNVVASQSDQAITGSSQYYNFNYLAGVLSYSG
ncbi:glucan endo-1,3-alpha-glucosidase, partial [Phenoliferia sp. Uapishka_3]